MKTKLALIQQIATANVDDNRNKGIESARQAIDQGARIICFAELAFQPFYPQLPIDHQTNVVAETIPGPTTDAFCELAKRHEVVFVLNLFEDAGNKRFDSSPVIDADGSIMGVTRMIHITDYPGFHEQDYYQPGDTNAPVYSTKYGKIGVAICYDRHYPEYMRALALAGAELVVIPQAGAVDEWPDGLYESELQVAAFQNGYFTALCNRVGEESHLIFGGESFVCNPEGKVIARAGKLSEETLLCDIELEEIHQSHAKKLFLRDRRPDLYADWLCK